MFYHWLLKIYKQWLCFIFWFKGKKLLYWQQLKIIAYTYFRPWFLNHWSMLLLEVSVFIRVVAYHLSFLMRCIWAWLDGYNFVWFVIFNYYCGMIYDFMSCFWNLMQYNEVRGMVYDVEIKLNNFDLFYLNSLDIHNFNLL